MGRSLGYMVVPILGGCDTLGASGRALNTKVPVFFFLTHLRQLRGYSALTDLVKNTLDTLLWIFEYITDWPFPGTVSTDFLRIFDISKSQRNSRAMDIQNFDP